MYIPNKIKYTPTPFLKSDVIYNENPRFYSTSLVKKKYLTKPNFSKYVCREEEIIKQFESIRCL